MYEQAVNPALQISAYIFGGFLFIIIALMVSVKIAEIASANKAFFQSKSALGPQAVIFNIALYVIAVCLLAKGSGLGG